jgi:hypothetical protein
VTKVTTLRIRMIRSTMVLLGSLAVSAGQNPESSHVAAVAGPGGWQSGGLLAFRTGEEENTEVHLIRVGREKTEHLFTLNMRETVKPPICLGDCVIVANVEGVVRKFDLSGNLVFSKKPPGFEGLGGLSGKINAKHMFLTETKWDAGRKSWKHALHLIDVSGTEPVIAASFRIRTLGRVVVVRDTVLIHSLHKENTVKTQKFRMPKRVIDRAVDREGEGAS